MDSDGLIVVSSRMTGRNNQRVALWHNRLFDRLHAPKHVLLLQQHAI